MNTFRRCSAPDRLEDASGSPVDEDCICETCGQFFWFCQGHPKPRKEVEPDLK